jgi:hypothetical protein
MRLAVDFGDRAAKGFVTKAALEMASEALEDTPTLSDVHGLMVYNDEPKPVFFSIGPATAILSPDGSAVIRTVQEAMRRNIVRTEEEHVAYDLFSPSFNTAGVVDARFVMLMMAIEATLVQEKRSSAAVALVEELWATVETSTLPPGDKASLLGGMAYRPERRSVSQADAWQQRSATNAATRSRPMARAKTSRSISSKAATRCAATSCTARVNVPATPTSPTVAPISRCSLPTCCRALEPVDQPGDRRGRQAGAPMQPW